MNDPSVAIVWATVDGLRTRLRTTQRPSAGTGAAPRSPRDPLILLHGLGCSSSAWLPSLRVFSKDDRSRTIIAPDFPGCGRSGCAGPALGITALADWVVQLMDVLEIERGCIGGNSLGCQVAMALARRHPERVDALVLLGATTGHSQVPFWRYALGLLWDAFGESVPYNLHLAYMYAQMGLRRYLATVHHMMADDPLAQASEIRCPTLILRGGRDRIVTEEMARGLAAALPLGEYQPLDSTAHAAEYNTPELFVNATVEFLVRVEGRRGEKARLK